MDAIPPDALRALVSERIRRHVDERQFAITRDFEEQEREVLMRMADARERSCDHAADRPWVKNREKG